VAETNCGFDDVPGGAPGSELLVSAGPTIVVNIGFDPKWKPALPVVMPIPGITDIRALVDTGATECCIDNRLAIQLNLPIVDERPYGGIGGRHMAKMYLAQVHIPSLNYTMYGAFAGVKLAESGAVHQALIGRTFLQAMKTTYDGATGKVVLSSV